MNAGVDESKLPPAPVEGRHWRRTRFSPQVLVLVATLAIASRPLKNAIITGVLWWWGDTYQQVEFVMDEARVNDGYPYLDGHLGDSTDVTRITGMMVGESVAPDGAPEDVFAPGKRLLIWRSPTAPDFGVEGASVNEFAVSTRPTLPGFRSFLDYAAMTAITLSAGLWATLRLGRRFRPPEHQIERRVAGVDGDD